MGEITDALRRARAEKESAKLDSPPKVAEAFAPEEGLEAAAAPDAPAPRPVAEFTESLQPTATISRDRRGFWQARAVHLDRPGAVAERFRHLAVRVRRELDAISGQTLMVASALRSEGKTVTSCNLALALASMASERRIALVDLDLRRPSVANAMGVRPQVGIESVLSGEVSLASARIPTDIPSFDLFLAAKPTRNAHELLATPTLDQVLAELRSHYAVVVVDTPPVLLVPDVPLMAPAFDACMVVGRVGKTSRSAFQEMIGLLPKDKVLGGFLNQVRAAGHADQYGYYLGDDEEEAKPGRRRRRRE